MFYKRLNSKSIKPQSILKKLKKKVLNNSNNNIKKIKEFLKAQTITAESLQEYFSDSTNQDISKYVHINSSFLNDFITKRVTFSF